MFIDGTGTAKLLVVLLSPVIFVCAYVRAVGIYHLNTAPTKYLLQLVTVLVIVSVLLIQRHILMMYAPQDLHSKFSFVVFSLEGFGGWATILWFMFRERHRTPGHLKPSHKVTSA